MLALISEMKRCVIWDGTVQWDILFTWSDFTAALHDLEPAVVFIVQLHIGNGKLWMYYIDLRQPNIYRNGCYLIQMQTLPLIPVKNYHVKIPVKHYRWHTDAVLDALFDKCCQLSTNTVHYDR